MMNELKGRYLNGEPIKSTEFIGNAKLFGSIAYPEWQKDKATIQSSLDGEIIWRRVKAEPEPLTPEEEHAARIDTVKGIVKGLTLHHLNKGAISYYLDKK